MTEKQDDLSAARGIIKAVLMCLAMWVLVLAALALTGCVRSPEEAAEIEATAAHRRSLEARTGTYMTLDGVATVYVVAVAFPEPACRVNLAGFVGRAQWVHCGRLTPLAGEVE